MKNAYRLVILCVLLLGSAGALSAQSGDLLTNAGFEAPFLPLSGDVPSNVAAGWSPWNVPASDGMSASDNVMPEYFAASDTVNGLSLTPRIHSGADAQQYFSYYSTHTGGLYQQVSGIAPGAELTFSTFAFLWASDASETSDGSGEIIFSVGLDPAGGTDGTSASIVWSEPASVYDEWTQSSVTATATGDHVTVFIRSTATAKIANNVIYVDDASLTAVGGAAVTEAAPTAEATDAVTTEAPVAVEPTAEVIATVEVTDAAPVVEVTEAVTEAVTEVAPTLEVVATTEAAPVIEATATFAPTVTPTSEVPTAVVEPTTEVVEPTSTATTEPTTVSSPVPSPTLDMTAFPQSFIYTVQSGDTVNDLALRYGSTIDAIITANGLNEFGFITVGQALIIPVSKLPTASDATATSAPLEATSTVAATVVAPTEVVPTVVAPTPVPPTVAAVNPLPVSQPVTYVIQFGDTLSSIAFRFGTTARVLAELNGITNPNLIYYGQLLIISLGSSVPPTAVSPATVVVPPTAQPTAVTGQSYRVLPGDNLYTISLRFGVSVSSLISANNLSNPNRIYVGQVLIIPAS